VRTLLGDWAAQYALDLDISRIGILNVTQAPDDIAEWLAVLLGSGKRVLVPEIADYEVRRELLRAGKTRGLRPLDELKAALGYVPITTEAMLKAAEFWAATRRLGRPTSHDKTLDADAILAGQAATFSGADVVVASTSPRHIARFVPATDWQEVGP
jgi:predicted nucleic acid-binding protein